MNVFLHPPQALSFSEGEEGEGEEGREEGGGAEGEGAVDGGDGGGLGGVGEGGHVGGHVGGHALEGSGLGGGEEEAGVGVAGGRVVQVGEGQQHAGHLALSLVRHVLVSLHRVRQLPRDHPVLGGEVVDLIALVDGVLVGGVGVVAPLGLLVADDDVDVGGVEGELGVAALGHDLVGALAAVLQVVQVHRQGALLLVLQVDLAVVGALVPAARLAVLPLLTEVLRQRVRVMVEVVGLIVVGDGGRALQLRVRGDGLQDAVRRVAADVGEVLVTEALGGVEAVRVATPGAGAAGEGLVVDDVGNVLLGCEDGRLQEVEGIGAGNEENSSGGGDDGLHLSRVCRYKYYLIATDQ